MKFALKAALGKLGMRTFLIIEYPNIGVNVRVRPHTLWKTLSEGKSEFNCIKYISNIVREGQTIFDAGAHIGMYTLLFSKLTGVTGKVIAFDPNPEASGILLDNLKKNNISNVSVEKICLSNSVGKVELKTQSLGSSMSSMTRYKQSESEELLTFTAKSTTIDEYCKENNLVPDGIKIDVEGAEGLVIEGMSEIIKDYSPWILLEFHGQFMDEQERKINWGKIVEFAKEIIFIMGNSNKYQCGDKIKPQVKKGVNHDMKTESRFPIPDCLYFHVFIRY